MNKVWLTVLLLTLGDFSKPSIPNTCLGAPGRCDDGWVEYKKACYKRVDIPLYWPEAQATCLSHDSHLASIHSSEENDFVFELMGKPSDPVRGKGYWIGMHDSFVEGNVMNADGSKVTFLAFGKGEPNNWGDEDYIATSSIADGHVTWNDCTLTMYKYPFVCKYYLGNRLCKRQGLTERKNKESKNKSKLI